MRSLLWSVSALIISVSLLMLGTGLFNTFVGLRIALEGFPREATGLMMSAYYGGLVVGTLHCGRLINRVGHIRAFTAFCSISSAVVLVFPFAVSVPLWATLRALNGFCLAGALMVVESWLNNRATGETRGTLLSAYMMTTFMAAGGGQFLLNLGNTDGSDLFLITAVLLSLALVPVAITRATHPQPVASSHFGFRRLFEISPVSVVGCLVSGLSVGALFGMGPIFGQELGMSVADISKLMGALVVSGLVLQVPLGRLSDRLDRRKVIVGANVAAVASALILVVLLEYAMVPTQTPAGTSEVFVREFFVPLLAAATIYGAVSATIYPICVAYANDYIDARDSVGASAGLVLAFGVGAALGPLSAAGFMRVLGPDGLFLFCALIAAALVVFALYRSRKRYWVPVMEKESFVALPEGTTTPIVLELDPRTEGTQLSFDFGPMPGDEAVVGESAPV